MSSIRFKKLKMKFLNIKTLVLIIIAQTLFVNNANAIDSSHINEPSIIGVYVYDGPIELTISNKSEIDLMVTKYCPLYFTFKNLNTYGFFSIQVGAFEEEEKAIQLKAQLDGFDVYIIQESGLFKVEVGKFLTRADAVDYRKQYSLFHDGFIKFLNSNYTENRD